MKSNLAVLSSDNKTIKFIKDNKINDLCYLYANSSRNIDNAQSFCNTNGFQKYYSSKSNSGIARITGRKISCVRF